MEPTLYIPHWNGGLLRRTIASLEAQSERCRVVIVDNASTDGFIDEVREGFPWVEVIRLERNRGFGVALNHATGAVGGDPLIFLNDDVECEPGFVEAMMARAGDAEMVAGVLLQDANPGLIDSAGVIADAGTLMAFDYLQGEPAEVAESAPPPLGPTGGAALYRREPFEAIGGFDERIFLYYEDLDLALRMHLAGARCVLASRARGRHVGSATLGQRSGEKYVHTGWSRAYMLRRYGVMRNPSNALRTLGSEAAICAGQVVLDHTFRGIVGRLRGWRDARGLERRELPAEGLSTVPVPSGLLRRARRRLGGRGR
ncbi:MAG: glycosyltransferase family 2 protein [Solirubrobacterales bacterium]